MPEVWQIIQSGVVDEGKVEDVSHDSLRCQDEVKDWAIEDMKNAQ